MDGNLIGSRTKKVGYTFCQYSVPCPQQLSGTQMATHRVVEHPIQVSLVRVQLHGPSMNVSSGICGATLRPDGRHTEEHIGLLANCVEEAGRGDIGAVVGAFKHTISSGSISMMVREGQALRIPGCFGVHHSVEINR